jgi:hypothetical protein
MLYHCYFGFLSLKAFREGRKAGRKEGNKEGDAREKLIV